MRTGGAARVDEHARNQLGALVALLRTASRDLAPADADAVLATPTASTEAPSTKRTPRRSATPRTARAADRRRQHDRARRVRAAARRRGTRRSPRDSGDHELLELGGRDDPARDERHELLVARVPLAVGDPRRDRSTTTTLAPSRASSAPRGGSGRRRRRPRRPRFGPRGRAAAARDRRLVSTASCRGARCARPALRRHARARGRALVGHSCGLHHAEQRRGLGADAPSRGSGLHPRAPNARRTSHSL